jgi:hypothetical protein
MDGLCGLVKVSSRWSGMSSCPMDTGKQFRAVGCLEPIDQSCDPVEAVRSIVRTRGHA